MNIQKIALWGATLIIGLLVVLSLKNSTAESFQPGYQPSTVQVKDGVQEATLRAEGLKFIVEPNTLQAGVPVKMRVDLSTVSGCLRNVVIPEFGVRETVSSSNNIIEFTPTKTGTFRIACAMNMGRGTFVVGEPSPAIQGEITGGGSCGAGGGGCGCGGA